MSSLKNDYLSNNLFLLLQLASFLICFQQQIVIDAAAINEAATENTTANICNTQACHNVETNLTKYIDPSIDPCKNFYNYVCLNFVKDSDLRNNLAAVDQFTIVVDRVIEQIKSIVRKKIDPNEPKAFQLVKTYYSACTNTTAIENRGLQPLKEAITSVGGWPVIVGNSWKENNFSWTKMDQNLQSLGLNPKNIFHLYVMKDIENTTRNILYISSIETDIENQLLNGLDDNVTKAYLDYMIETAVLLGANRSRAIDDMKEALMFEMRLVEPAENHPEDLDPDSMVASATIKNLQTLFPYVSWLDYLNNVTYPSGNFTENDEVRIDNPLYLQKLKRLLTTTPKRVIANFMIWKYIDRAVQDLSSKIREKKLKFVNVYIGKVARDPAEKECIQNMIINNNGLMVGAIAMYVKEYFSDQTRQKIEQMLINIQEHYNDILKKADWISEETRQTALRKNKLMRRVIGYPDEIRNMDIVNDYYGDLELSPNDHFHNAMKLKTFVFQSAISKLKKTPNETFWLDAGITANIYPMFNSLYNAIILPAWVLQQPFFDEKQPNFINYGSLGFIVSHELGHAFHNGDFQLDEYGKLREWWALKDQEKYLEKATCFVDQYNNFTAGSNSLGESSIEENIADNQGLKASFNAYKKWESLNGVEARLPRLNYTNEQLFMISVANTLCTKQSEERKMLQLTEDVHAPDNIRVRGIVSNAAEFPKLFDCPVNSPMNPRNKCSLW